MLAKSSVPTVWLSSLETDSFEGYNVSVKLLETIVGGLLDPAGYFAKRIRESVKGLGTNDSRLVRVIVSSSEVDLGRIKQAYQTMYGRDMLHDVRDDTSGYYKEILTGLISRC